MAFLFRVLIFFRGFGGGSRREYLGNTFFVGASGLLGGVGGGVLMCGDCEEVSLEADAGIEIFKGSIGHAIVS